MAKRSVSPRASQTFERLGRLIAAVAESNVYYQMSRGGESSCPPVAINDAIAGPTYPLNHHPAYLKVRNLLRAHLERRLLTRNGGWRRPRPGSPAAKQLRRQIQERAIRRAAEQKIGRLSV